MSKCLAPWVNVIVDLGVRSILSWYRFASPRQDFRARWYAGGDGVRLLDVGFDPGVGGLLRWPWFLSRRAARLSSVRRQAASMWPSSMHLLHLVVAETVLQSGEMWLGFAHLKQRLALARRSYLALSIPGRSKSDLFLVTLFRF